MDLVQEITTDFRLLSVFTSTVLRSAQIQHGTTDCEIHGGQ